MASNPPQECCGRGFKHEGNPAGEIKEINGKCKVLSSVRQSPNLLLLSRRNQNPDHAILYLSDIMGIYSNSQLLADSLASQGYLVMMPDFFRGEPWTLNSDMSKLMGWDIDPIVEAAVKYLREEKGYKKIAAVGYCFGAKYVCRFMKQGKIDVGFIAHPSFVTDEELAGITGPLSIAAAETDRVFPTELRHKSEEILKKTGLPYQINLFSGVEHGFAARADLSQRQAVFARDQAFNQAVTWFKWHL
uniref:Dienelactone hydrolase family protein n=1 Tax=Coccidioides posadasii RMSCC 3488 TaxID=454284 RepID=A0A0J6FLG1_COCPO|nr:dienelactone hydrolase family protein [Coccidioides posadasii RMSCC 3488]